MNLDDAIIMFFLIFGVIVWGLYLWCDWRGIY